MTDTEVHVEHEHSEEHEDHLAEAIAEAQVEAAHTLQQEADIENAQETAENALQAVSEQIGHEHVEYALAAHSHPENDVSERLSVVEARIEAIEHGLEESLEEPTVEEIEPVEEEHHEPERQRRHRFGRR